MEHRVGWLDPVFVALSVVGFAGLLWVVLAPALAAWTGRRVLPVVAATVVCLWVSDLVVFALKLLVARPRPSRVIPDADPLLGAAGYSFPSGHAATSFAGAVILGFLVRRAVPALVALATLIAFSRVYVGVHCPADVLAGAAVGAAVAGAAVLVVLRVPRGVGRGRRRSGGSPPPG